MTLHPVPFLVIFRNIILPGSFAGISKQVIQWSVLCEPFKTVLTLDFFFFLRERKQTNRVYYFFFVHVKEKEILKAS